MDPILKAFNEYMAVLDELKKAHETEAAAYKAMASAKTEIEQVRQQAKEAETKLICLMEPNRPYRTPEGYRIRKDNFASIEIMLPEVVLSAD